MPDTIRVRSLASAAALALAIAQPAWSGEEPAAGSAVPAAPVVTPESVVAPINPPAAPAPTAMPAAPMAPPAAEQPPAPPAAEASAPEPAPAAEASPAEAARAKAEARRAEMDAERNKRYQELRERAKEVGLELPETPPWESAQAGMPQMPQMPAHGGRSAEQFQAMREQRESMREKMKSMTPEERKAMREAHWKEMRTRAAERGIEMPETPPWEEAEKRYQEARAQFEQYRKTVDEMTEEQIEAARAIFGRAGGPSDAGQGMTQPMPPQMPQMPQGYGYGPQGGYPGHTPYQGGPGQMMMGRPPMQPYYEGGMDQGPPAPMGPQGY